MRAVVPLFLIAGCSLLPDDQADFREALLRGTWLDPPERAHLDEPWTRITFAANGLYSQSTFSYFYAQWNLTADSLRYEFDENVLRMERSHGPMVAAEVLTLTDTTFAYVLNGRTVRLRRPRAGDPAY